jgi:hypothetical protein
VSNPALHIAAAHVKYAARYVAKQRSLKQSGLQHTCRNAYLMFLYIQKAPILHQLQLQEAQSLCPHLAFAPASRHKYACPDQRVQPHAVPHSGEDCINLERVVRLQPAMQAGDVSQTEMAMCSAVLWATAAYYTDWFAWLCRTVWCARSSSVLPGAIAA